LPLKRAPDPCLQSIKLSYQKWISREIGKFLPTRQGCWSIWVKKLVENPQRAIISVFKRFDLPIGKLDRLYGLHQPRSAILVQEPGAWFL